MNIVADATRIALERERQKEWDYLCDLQQDRAEAIRHRAGAYILDAMRYAIYRQERVVTDLDSQLAAER